MSESFRAAAVDSHGATSVAHAIIEGDFCVVDLSQPLSPEMARWRGTELAAIEQTDVPMEHAVPDARISATRISMVVHAGTHVEGSRHFYANGREIGQYPPDRFICRGQAVDVSRAGREPLTADELRAADPGIGPGDAVLLYFGYADRYTSDDYYDHPHLSPEAADYLIERRIGLLGVDLITPDCSSRHRPPNFDFPIHTRLLREDILIVENLGPGVKKVLGRSFTLILAPLPLTGAEASPVAPLAIVSQASPELQSDR